MNKHDQHGATLVELFVGIVILGVLMGLALPSFNSFIASSRLRTTAESILAGLQLARAEAIRRNLPVCFYIETSGTTAGVWQVNLDDSSRQMDCSNSNKFASASSTAYYRVEKSLATEAVGITMTATPTAATTITFNAFGKVTANAGDNNASLTSLVLSTADTSQTYRVELSTGGQVHLCVPGMPTSDPRHCQSS